MKARILLLSTLMLLAIAGWAQRVTDKLDRGLVAVPANANGGSGSGNVVTWRVFAEEYYDVTYNLYCNGSKIASNLKVACYNHTGGSASSKYQVAPVVRGVEQAKCDAVTRWNDGYLDIPVATVTDRNGNDVTSQYILNDISLGDVDGDGITEFIVKRNYTGGDLNTTDNKTKFHHYECYNIKGERLWWIDMGPNMMAGPDEQWDIVAFDWDQDGKAECILRGADNMIIHTAAGATINVGNMNYVAGRHQYTCEGNEYLLYLNGLTGEPYPIGQNDALWMTYPLPRYDSGESDYVAAWGGSSNGGHDGGHRSSKHYFGAPFLDGRHPSIFLGRGCYTRHKMTAFDVDPLTHKLTQRWYWANNGGWSDPWFGNGYHNFAIADVDEDGRDEIVFGSMVVDDNGKGLSTTGLGHGDAQMCGDLDPYRKGLEQFACNEEEPNMNYRNATTSKIYYRSQGTADDGRSLCANFSNSFPGCMGRTVNTGLVSTVADREISGGPGTGDRNDALFWSHLNFRIYWDGDLCDEVLDSPGTEREAAVYKPGGGRLFTSSGCQMNNDSKNNPCAMGDILGDWREEIVVRANGSTAIRIYTTPHVTTFRIPTLWHDHQYRNAMVWQPVGYNQPPGKSFFIGQLEGITVAPPPYTMTGRTEVPNGGTISAAYNGQQVIVCETNDTQVTIDNGAEPWVAFFSVPSWVQGTNSPKTDGTADIRYNYYTCTVTGGGLAGSAHLVKQGDGILSLPAADFTHTAGTEIWAGTVNFDGTMLKSSLWLNRFAQLNTNGGKFRSIKADYAAVLSVKGQVTTDSLLLGFGARTAFELAVEGGQHTASCIAAKNLSIETKNWQYGPKYSAPVFEFSAPLVLTTDELQGRYLLLQGVEKMTGRIDNVIIEGLGTTLKTRLEKDGTDIYLVVSGVREAADVVWNGAQSTTWEFGGAANFTLISDPSVTDESFVTGDRVHFDDTAAKFTVSLKGEIDADSVIVDASKSYTFNGTGALIGNTTLVKRGTGTLTITNDNTYKGGTRISGGTLSVASLSNANQDYGNLGAVNTAASRFIIENGATLRTTATVTQGSPMQMATAEGGVLNCSNDFNMNQAINGTLLTKQGNGCLKLYANNGLSKMIIAAGSVAAGSGNPASTVEFQGGTLYDDAQATTHAIVVPEGQSGTWQLTNTYYTAYANKITGSGTLTIIPRNTVSRVRITGDWSKFEGTIKHTNKDIWLPLDMSSGMPKGTLFVDANCGVCNTAKAFAVGQLTGSGSLVQAGPDFQSKTPVSGNNTWNVGNSDGNDFTFAGTFTDDGGSNKVLFNKVGTCKMTVSGKSNNSGATTVKAGELCLKSGATIGTGTLTVSRAAILSGITGGTNNLTNSSYSISAGGTLQVGATATATSGIMGFGNKNVTFARNSYLQIGIARAATGSATGGTYIQNIAKLTMNGTVQLHYSSTARESFVEGDSILLWKNVETVTGTPVLDEDSRVIDVARRLAWDTTDIAKGILRVVYDPTIIQPGDVNGDGIIDLTDAIMIVYYSLGSEPAGFNEEVADINGDGVIDLTDAITVVYRSLE